MCCFTLIFSMYGFKGTTVTLKRAVLAVKTTAHNPKNDFLAVRLSVLAIKTAVYSSEKFY